MKPPVTPPVNLSVVPLQTDAQLEHAYAHLGLLRKEQLHHGAYYRGSSRNATVARWHADAECFVHWRDKLGERFLETVCHPQDDRIFEVFRPVERIEPVAAEIVEDDGFDAVAQRRSNGLQKARARFAQREQARQQAQPTPAPAAPANRIDGVAAANRAVAQAGPDSSLIFLPRSQYEDLIYRANLPELKTYKGKHIVVVSDDPLAPG